MSQRHADKEVKPAHTPRTPESSSQEAAVNSSGSLVDLQRTLGNQAVQRLIANGRLQVGSGVLQAKLTVGPVDDPYEQEADSVAQQVMTMPDAVQRDELPPEDEDLRMKRIQRNEALMQEDELMTKRVQRDAMIPEEETLQAKSDGGVPEVTDDLEQSIESSRGAGQALPDSARGFFEPRFGQDFSSVNIHTGGEADSLNQQLQARAFTTGSDIYFREGEYNPDSSAGRELLAHELTHVVQQGGSIRRNSDAENQTLGPSSGFIQRELGYFGSKWEQFKEWSGLGADEVKVAKEFNDKVKKAIWVCEKGAKSLPEGEARKHLESAISHFGTISELASKGIKIHGAVTEIVEFADAVERLNKIDIEKNPGEAADAFGQLFASAGKLGKNLPEPFSAYFELLAGARDFFTNMHAKLDPSVRWKKQFDEIERESRN